MILLDTDHLSVLSDERDFRHGPLDERVQGTPEQVACTIVSVEEVFRGWTAIIHRLRDVRRQVPAYSRLGRFIAAVAAGEVIAFDERAADQFRELRGQKIRIGTNPRLPQTKNLASDLLNHE